MIRSIRSVRAPALRAWLSNTALVHTRLRLHAVDNARVVNEDILLMRAYGRAGAVGRPTLTALLEGEARISAHGQHAWLVPGDVVVVDTKSAIRMRQAGETFRSLAFEWDAEWLGACRVPAGRWSAPTAVQSALREVWRGVRSDEAPDALVEALLRALASMGVPLARAAAPELAEDVPPHMHELTRALDRSLSDLSHQPMLLDLEKVLGLSARQVNRLVAAYNERYGFNSAGWIDTRNRRRVMMGATFMTVPGATARYVARVVGYRSAAAFTRALRSAHLPAPTQIAHEVAALYDSTR